jgi:uroporphyrin-III C-methyltransferase
VTIISGKVYLVGAGPGDPGLLTVKALELIKKADVILYDRLVNEDLLRFAKKGANIIFVGKTPGSHIIDQNVINEIIAREARDNKIVIRLKGGDPFVLGRGGEEAHALRQIGINFEVVPGVTSAIAVPEAAGIPITDRRASSSFTIVSGHAAKGRGEYEVDFAELEADTIIILMGLGNLERIVAQLLLDKRASSTPVAVIQQGTTRNEKVAVGTLENIVQKVRDERIRAPTIIVVGDVVNLRG